ncbi:hypothetical protein UFOVP503_19 [uncultured Caudovirales phage]|uniref:Uncharacterized protein n=1 Tax=uncultured Caudovirales phage TaxID=2100421 RepID=A0A6J5MHE0_9CAUD|nr:hypothetical protein UFOVP503_19 [uncultured Caudovirales phage]CAB4160781.1 hypothetical protein UFOVP763_13 [uncultured Caudovirales phage]
MSRHRLTYIDLHPEPLERAKREPSTLQIVVGAVVALIALYITLVVAFSL